MKWLLAAFLWGAAGLIAVAVVWRWYRGRNIVLRGTWSPRFVRMVAIVLVMLGMGNERVSSAERGGPQAEKKRVDAPRDELPVGITPTMIQQWLSLQRGDARGNALHWPRLKVEMTRDISSLSQPELLQLKQLYQRLPPLLAKMLADDVDALAKKNEAQALEAGAILALYDEFERHGYYDHWLNAYLWRKTASLDAEKGKQLAEVFSRMHRHARLTDTLIRAQGEAKPYMIPPRAWMSKGGITAAERQREAKGLVEMLDAAKTIYPAMDGGTWKRDAVSPFAVAKDSPAPHLLRAGRIQPWPSGATLRFGRLDLLETQPGNQPVVLEHAWLGQIALPPQRTISVWQMPGLLSKEAQKKLDKAVEDALAGDEEAADKLELALPLAHVSIRHGVAKFPKAKLAPRLRMLLSLYDDAIMPALAPSR